MFDTKPIPEYSYKRFDPLKKPEYIMGENYRKRLALKQARKAKKPNEYQAKLIMDQIMARKLDWIKKEEW